MRTVLKLSSALGMLALFALGQPAAAAVAIYANGGNYFQASGPAYNWRYDYGEGYCGKIGLWCSPKHFQWTYNNRVSYSPENQAMWWPIVEEYNSRAFAFIPRRNATTRAAPYTVIYGGVSRASSYVDQNSYYDAWAPLARGQSLYRISGVSLHDYTMEYSPTKIAFDEIKIEN